MSNQRTGAFPLFCCDELQARNSWRNLQAYCTQLHPTSYLSSNLCIHQVYASTASCHRERLIFVEERIQNLCTQTK